MSRDEWPVKSSAPPEATQTNHQFHAIICLIASNNYLLASIARLQSDHTRMSQTFFRPGVFAHMVHVVRAIEQHDAMIAAVGAGDGETAIDLTIQHWNLSRDQMELQKHPDPLPVDFCFPLENHHTI